MKNDDDKLYGEIFGASDKEDSAPTPPEPVKAKVAAPRPEKPAPVAVPAASAAPMAEDAVNEAAHLFQEMMADERKAAAVAKKMKPPPPPPPEPMLIRQAVAVEEEKPKVRFADSVAPWTLFKGMSTLAMLVYIVGFHGRLLHDSWPALAVISVALTGAVLIADYLRAAAAASSQEPKKKHGA